MGLQFRKSKMVLNYLKGKPTVFAAQQITFPAVRFEQLVNECSGSCGVNPSQTNAVVNALIDRLVHYMELGHGVKLGKFGSFKPTFRKKAAKSLDDVDASTVVKKVIRFYPGPAFREMLNVMTVEAASKTLNYEDEEEQEEVEP